MLRFRDSRHRVPAVRLCAVSCSHNFERYPMPGLFGHFGAAALFSMQAKDQRLGFFPSILYTRKLFLWRFLSQMDYPYPSAWSLFHGP